MVKRSRGKMSKRSRLLRKKAGGKGVGLSRVMGSFNIGDKVYINLLPGYSGAPHPKYRGRHGIVVGAQGNAYIIEIQDFKRKKRLIVSPVHLSRS